MEKNEAMRQLIGCGITGQPLLRRSVNPPSVWVKYTNAKGQKRKRQFGSPSCALVFAKEAKGMASVLITDETTRLCLRYANGILVQKKRTVLDEKRS